jgi:hypothetical protein
MFVLNILYFSQGKINSAKILRCFVITISSMLGFEKVKSKNSYFLKELMELEVGSFTQRL